MGTPCLEQFELWTILNQLFLKLESSIFAWLIFLRFKHLFDFGPRKVPANWRIPRPHIAAADADRRGHETKKFLNRKKKNKTEKKINTLSSVLTVLEQFYISSEKFNKKRVSAKLFSPFLDHFWQNYIYTDVDLYLPLLFWKQETEIRPLNVISVFLKTLH